MENDRVRFCRVIGHATGKPLELCVMDAETIKECKHFETDIRNGTPYLVVEEGAIYEAAAIAQYLADGHPTLLGSNSW
jgi:hypothetical protein